MARELNELKRRSYRNLYSPIEFQSSADQKILGVLNSLRDDTQEPEENEEENR